MIYCFDILLLVKEIANQKHYICHKMHFVTINQSWSDDNNVKNRMKLLLKSGTVKSYDFENLSIFL